jgi:Family of unknown function (DUF6528)
MIPLHTKRLTLLLPVLLTVSSWTARADDELILCGWDEVFALKVGNTNNISTNKVWSWRARDCPNLPKELRDAFGTTDECKPVENGEKILITSSGGGVALVERASGRVSFATFVGNAHSAEMLSRGRMVVAASTHARGNRLAVFDLAQPAESVCMVELPAAHGVVWDEKRQTLWALGHDELNGYRLANWAGAQPRLHLDSSYPLPDPSGHDLQPAPHSDFLVLTTGSHVYVFDRERRAFFPHMVWGNKAGVKCVSIHPRTRLTALIQADDRHWWSDTVQWLDFESALKLPGQRLYKARWNVKE